MLSNLADYSVPRAGRGKFILAYDSLRSKNEEFPTAADASCRGRPGPTYVHEGNNADLRWLLNGPTIKKIGHELRVLELNQCLGAFIETLHLIYPIQ
jgi:hypothetical protein